MLTGLRSEEANVGFDLHVPQRVESAEDHFGVGGNSIVNKLHVQERKRGKKNTNQVPVEKLDAVLLTHVEASVVSRSSELRQVGLQSQRSRDSQQRHLVVEIEYTQNHRLIGQLIHYHGLSRDGSHSQVLKQVSLASAGGVG